MPSRDHVNFQEVFSYLSGSGYPSGMGKNEKANFRRCCKPFLVADGELFYIGKESQGTRKRVLIEKGEQIRAIKAAHEGLGTSVESAALAGHRGINATYSIVTSRFYWRTMDRDVKEYVGTCGACQKVNPKWKTVKPPLHPVPVPQAVMRQIGVDIASLPEIDGLRYVVFAVDYFSKWSEGRALRDKTAESVAIFLFEDIICRHGCPSIQINDQGREFVNAVSTELHRLCGIKQRVTSAYHPQANGLVERQNRTIKEKLLKVLGDETASWPRCLQPLLFSHRTTVHCSTRMSPFYVMYGRNAVLPFDVRSVEDMEDNDHDGEDKSSTETEEDEPSTEIPEEREAGVFEFDDADVKSYMHRMVELREAFEKEVTVNIKLAQKKQKKDYDHRQGLGGVPFAEGDMVLLRDLRRLDRKGGKSKKPWLGPYKVSEIFENHTVALETEDGRKLKKKHNLASLKQFRLKQSEDHVEEADDLENDNTEEENDGTEELHRTEGDSRTEEHSRTEDTKNEDNWWIRRLHLKLRHKNLIRDCTCELDDTAIDAALTLLKEQFPSMNGLESPLLQSNSKGSNTLRAPIVQIHHDEKRQHWIVSGAVNGRLEICDSLRLKEVSDNIAQQLVTTYGRLYAQEGQLPYYVLPTQSQVGVDCGLHAIATATQLCFGEDPTVHFKRELLRQHTVECFEQETMRPFPTQPRRGRKGVTKKKSVTLKMFSSHLFP